MPKIKVALIGVGNCASSLVQGVSYYAAPTNQVRGLMHERIGDYGASDIDFVLAIDADARKVGRDLSEAIFAAPNCTTVFQPDVAPTGTRVMMGRMLDGIAPHMTTVGDKGFIVANDTEANHADIVKAIKDSGAEVLINFLPVGSQEATEFYMECALEAGVAVVNCMPVFIASTPEWEAKFRAKNLPIVGDDIKAQVGATIVHRVLSSLFAARGVTV
ncbi:MAG: inositol-3-phosphate synthase, partial [Sphingomonas sp.]